MAKQKMKSHRGASKRFKITGSGKVKRNKAYKSHILTKKSQKRKVCGDILTLRVSSVVLSTPAQ